MQTVNALEFVVLGVFLRFGFFFFYFIFVVVVVLLCLVTAFLPHIPKETSKYEGKKAMLRTRVKAKQKGREGKKIYIERRIKESSGGPAELSSRGLGFL